MKVSTTPLSGLMILEPAVYTDSRGYFHEGFHQNKYTALNIPPFVQDNLSRSTCGVLRGLHYQKPHAQGKLVSVINGCVWDVAVDIRIHSPTFMQWFGITLNDENHTQLYIPPGFAHGFCVLSETADFLYKCTDFYAPESEHGIIWNDSTLNISWPIGTPILSPKDVLYSPLNEIPHDKLFA